MRRGHLSIWVRIPLILVALLTVWVWQRVTVVKMIRANDLLRVDVRDKEETRDKVAAEVIQLTQRTRIEKIATESLGLAPTRPGQQRFFFPGDFSPAPDKHDGWQRLNNSLRKLSVASLSPGSSEGTAR